LEAVTATSIDDANTFESLFLGDQNLCQIGNEAAACPIACGDAKLRAVAEAAWQWFFGWVNWETHLSAHTEAAASDK
jgi:hypothetical protein